MFTLSVLKACLAGFRIFGPDIIAVEEDKRRQEVEEHPEQDDVPDQQPEHMDAEVEQQVEEVAEETRGEEPVENADLSVTDLLIRVNLQKMQNIFEEEEIKMQTLRSSTATSELGGILKISFGSAKLIVEEVARVARVNADATSTLDQTSKLIVEEV